MARRRFTRSPRAQRGPKRERFWIQKAYAPTVEESLEVVAIELLGSVDYTEGDNPALVDHCTVLRTLGRFEIDPIVATTADGGTASTLYAAYIGVVSEIALLNALIASSLNDYRPGTPLAPTRVRRVLQTWFARAFTSTVFTAGTPPPFLPVQTGDEQRFGVDWDVTQKVKLKADEAVYMFITAETVGTIGEGTDWAWFLNARTLFAD